MQGYNCVIGPAGQGVPVNSKISSSRTTPWHVALHSGHLSECQSQLLPSVVCTLGRQYVPVTISWTGPICRQAGHRPQPVLPAMSFGLVSYWSIHPCQVDLLWLSRMHVILFFMLCLHVAQCTNRQGT